MGPVFFLCKILLPNSRFGIRVLQFDSGITHLKHGGNSLRRFDYAINTAVRHQTTKTGARVPESRVKHRSKKKALVDIIRVKEESVSEGKAKVTRLNQHSIDRTLGILPAVCSSRRTARDHETGSSSPMISHDFEHLGEEVSFEKFSNLLKIDHEKGLLSVRNISEVHTYDANFMMSDNLRSHEKSATDDYWDIDMEYKKEMFGNTDLQSSPCDLSTLSSPLAGFAHFSEIDPVVKDRSNAIKDKVATSHKPKKKVISSKKKSTADDKNKILGQKSKKKVKAALTKNLLEVENITFGIGSSRVDDCVMEALDDAVVLDESKMSSKGKQMKRPSTKIFKKKLHQEQQLKEIVNIKKQCREILFNQTIEAYLSVCVNVGLLNRALHTLVYYRQLGTYGAGKKITSVQPYNIILQGLAEKGHFAKMEELRYLLEQEKIDLNAASYSSFLNCLGRQPVSYTNTVNIGNILDIMRNGGMEINKVFTEVEHVQGGYENVLKAVRRVIPKFVPEKNELSHFYNCNLLNDLNDTMHSSKVRPPLAGLATEQELTQWTEEQFSGELSGEITINSIQKKEETSEVKYFREKLARWEAKWREALHSDFVTKVDALKRNFSSVRRKKEMNIYPYLVSLPPEDYVNILLQEINLYASGSEGYSLSRYNLYRAIGEKVYQRYLIYYKKDAGILSKLKYIYKKYGSWMLHQHHGDGISYNPRVHWKYLTSSEPEGYTLEHNVIEWPNNVLLAVGQFLYTILLRNVMVWKPLHSEKHVYPAFYEIDRSYDYKVIEEIKPAPVLMELYRKAARPTLTFASNVAPMVSPPIPWTSPKCGGFLFNSSHIVRLPYNALQQKHRMEEIGKQQLYPVMDSLNQLGSVPWRVNKPMLDLIVEVFNNKGWEKMDIPLPVSECPVPPKIKSSMSASEKKQILRQRLEYNKKKSEMFSLWCDALYKLSFANHFRDRIIWFPHNMDFRGRVYPIPPHFNHMSSDVFRSLLFFARGEKLGPKGLKWLKLHLINLTGLVKRESVEDRLKYCETVLDDIIDSADRPLTGRQWWTKSDEPWQTLAACKELAAAICSGNPEEYVSHLPIHQDGSCNGLQHYAALGRDVAGAISVNLAPSRVPQDVYSAVAALVEKERLKDVLEGKEIAKMLEGYVHRKVIKQTVMTTVYGVTRFGARLQIEKQLKDLNFPPNKTWVASQYLANKTFLSLEQMFTSAKEIQDWFTDSARMVSKTCRQNVEWVTPLGLPVVQHYTIPLNERCATVKMGMTVNIDYIMQPNTMKQKNAFPPNFIHSLDSSHMMLTSIYSQRADVCFVSVHDCFWTHANSVETMNKICREQFVALHSEPILEDLSEYLKQQFSFEYKDFAHDGSAKDSAKMKFNTLLCNIPSKGDFDIRKVLESVYFFS